MWFYINGRLTRLTGTQDEVFAALVALRDANVPVKAARPPAPITPRTYAMASAHVRR